MHTATQGLPSGPAAVRWPICPAGLFAFVKRTCLILDGAGTRPECPRLILPTSSFCVDSRFTRPHAIERLLLARLGSSADLGRMGCIRRPRSDGTGGATRMRPVRLLARCNARFSGACPLLRSGQTAMHWGRWRCTLLRGEAPGAICLDRH